MLDLKHTKDLWRFDTPGKVCIEWHTLPFEINDTIEWRGVSFDVQIKADETLYGSISTICFIYKAKRYDCKITEWKSSRRGNSDHPPEIFADGCSLKIGMSLNSLSFSETSFDELSFRGLYQQEPSTKDTSTQPPVPAFLKALNAKWDNSKVGQTFVILKGVKKDGSGDDLNAKEQAMLKVLNLQAKVRKWKQEKEAHKSKIFLRMKNILAPLLFTLGLITLCTFFTPVHYSDPYDNFGNYYRNDLTNIFTVHPIDYKKLILYILIWFLICAALQYIIKSYEKT